MSTPERIRARIRRELYPFDSRFYDLGGLRMHYIDEGRGAPIVCVHGNPTWSFFYRDVIRTLSDRRRVIAPDHIGCGLSDKPGDAEYDYCLRRRIDDLESLLDHLALNENVTLVLHDWGGMIGMGVAVRRPQRIARLVILNTAAFRLPAGKPLPWRLRLIRDGGPLATLAVRGLNLFAWPATFMAAARPLPADVRAGYLAPYDSWASRIATLRFVQDIPIRPSDRSFDEMASVEARLTLLAGVPMLICWGLRDFVFDAHFLNEWRRRFPAAEVREFPDAGHYVIEDAGDRVLPVIRDFVIPAGERARG
ncbi:MAG: alpha/beta fold hydrolase [Phycisphaerae bacterium]|nr:alpha/beta fold hydrolase [Phycisphaerae bacterium]NUQ47399.1 alpha/beta fold hydrolase [Phycisphaerae bacterium]